MTNERPTGLDLKLERVRRQVPAKAVAEAMGISAGRLSRIEKPAPVTEAMRARYLLAVETCRTSGTAAA